MHAKFLAHRATYVDVCGCVFVHEMLWNLQKSATVSCCPHSKHMQCQVNLEPAVERRRRLARGRVQKYRSRNKRRQKVNKGDTVHIMTTESVF